VSKIAPRKTLSISIRGMARSSLATGIEKVQR
jgi:hypothetical protein